MTGKRMFGFLALFGLSAIVAQNVGSAFHHEIAEEQFAKGRKETLSSRPLSGKPEAQYQAAVLRTYGARPQAAQLRPVALRSAAPAASQTAASRTNVAAAFDPVLKEYCMSCHNQNRKAANLSLESLSKDVSEATGEWEKILTRLRARRDPPSDQPRPNEGAYQSMISTLELALDQAYPNAAASGADRFTDAELAARMATFIWNGEPDAALLDVVQRGRLRDPAVLEQQVGRMLLDDKSAGLATNFLERWTISDGLDKIAAGMAKGVTRLPGFDESLRQAFGTETRLFLENQVRDDHNALDLWTANYTFLNERLARHYGISNVTGDTFRRVPLPNSDRAGILGQGSFLTVTSIATRTSPTIRGKTILMMFFGVTPPDPAPNVPPIKDGPQEMPRSMRDRLGDHKTNPACVNCHATFDPLGLALENFNAIGAFRTADGNGAPIDASGIFSDGSRFTSLTEFRSGLLKFRDAYYHNVAQAILAYSLGKGRSWKVNDSEMPTVRAIVREAAAHDYRWSSMVLGVVKSAPFQTKTVVQPPR